MKLKLGIMTNKEIADWFGVTEQNISKHKTKFLKRLETYAKATAVRGGIKITEIMCDEYIRESSAYADIKNKFDDVWAADGFDTCKHVSDQLYASHSVLKKNGDSISSGTCYEYTRAARLELYGSPATGAAGKLGTSEFKWGKIDATTGAPVPLTDEEELIRKKYADKYFGSAAEKTIEVLEMIENKRLDPSCAWDYFTTIFKADGTYKEFLDDLRAEGIELRRCTVIHRNFPK